MYKRRHSEVWDFFFERKQEHDNHMNHGVYRVKVTFSYRNENRGVKSYAHISFYHWVPFKVIFENVNFQLSNTSNGYVVPAIKKRISTHPIIFMPDLWAVVFSLGFSKLLLYIFRKSREQSFRTDDEIEFSKYTIFLHRYFAYETWIQSDPTKFTRMKNLKMRKISRL